MAEGLLLLLLLAVGIYDGCDEETTARRDAFVRANLTSGSKVGESGAEATCEALPLRLLDSRPSRRA